MRRIFTLCIVAMFAVSSAYGWGRREHAVVAKIAEDHLTPKAKKCLYEYMHRRSLVYYASYADDYQPIDIDLGWQPSNDKRVVVFPHTFTVDENCRPIEGVRDGDKYVKNCIYFIDQWAQELKANHAKMNDSVRMMHIALIVHAMGDMHCPVRVRYPNDDTLSRHNVIYGKKPRSLYGHWDWGFVAATNSIASYTDFARYIDICSAEEIAEVCKGGLYDWGEQVARAAIPMRRYKADEVIDQVQFKREHLEKGEELLRNAGYRLAKLLNNIFE